MKIQLVSSLLSNRVLEGIRLRTGQYPAYAVQKFYRLLAEGFVKNDVPVEVISNPPAFASIDKVVKLASDTENGITYKYMPFINKPFLRHFSLSFNAFKASLKYCRSEEEDKAIICDILCYSTCMGALIAAKLTGTKIVGLVTDMPWLVDEDGRISLKMRLLQGFQKWYIRKYSHYIFLTEQMNEPINTKHRPYIIIEGFANVDMQHVENLLENKETPRQLLYAGFLQAKYGLKMLVDGFMSLKGLDAKLVVYGTGPYAEELAESAKKDERIEYRGLANNNEIVNAELKATVLINPRPTHEEYTKYSFPSKNIEYMASGTPILTTKLPGMPAEYYSYIYSFEEETTEGYARIINQVMNLSAEELHAKGAKAKAWVLKKKNNIHQCNRILEMLKS